MKLQICISLLLTTGLAIASLPSSNEVGTPQKEKPTIVLVHGAFADGSSWSKVIPMLEHDGYKVIAVQDPMTSFADDVTKTKRAIDGVKGPVVLVGHSYGGAVITGAAYGASNVKALVYISAFAPDDGETLGELNQKYPAQIGDALQPDAAGFLYVDRAKFHEDFCADLSEEEANLLAATQGPVNSSVFTQKFGPAAWKTIPSWDIITTEDRAINPELQHFYAKRMNAKVTEVKSSHVSFLSHPDVVTRVIEAAAESVSK